MRAHILLLFCQHKCWLYLKKLCMFGMLYNECIPVDYTIIFIFTYENLNDGRLQSQGLAPARKKYDPSPYNFFLAGATPVLQSYKRNVKSPHFWLQKLTDLTLSHFLRRLWHHKDISCYTEVCKTNTVLVSPFSQCYDSWYEDLSSVYNSVMIWMICHHLVCTCQ